MRAENLLAGCGGDAERAAARAIRTGAGECERFHIRGQRIEIRAHARLGIAERLVARAGVELRIGHEAGATGQSAYLAFEVLHFIKVARPMQHALIGMAFQRDGVAQTFTKIGQVPHAAIMPGIVVADGAADVLLQRQPWILRIIEELLALQHLGSELFRGDGVERGGGDGCGGGPLQDAADIMHGDRAIHEVLHIQRVPIR